MLFYGTQMDDLNGLAWIDGWMESILKPIQQKFNLSSFIHSFSWMVFNKSGFLWKETCTYLYCIVSNSSSYRKSNLIIADRHITRSTPRNCIFLADLTFLAEGV